MQRSPFQLLIFSVQTFIAYHIVVPFLCKELGWWPWWHSTNFSNIYYIHHQKPDQYLAEAGNSFSLHLFSWNTCNRFSLYIFVVLFDQITASLSLNFFILFNVETSLCFLQAFVDYFSRAMEWEYRGSGITVQTLTPAYVSTNMTKFSELVHKPGESPLMSAPLLGCKLLICPSI